MIINSIAIIQNKTLTENKISWPAYYVFGMSTIIIKNAAFTQNNLTIGLLLMSGKSKTTMQDKTLTENNMLFTVYGVSVMSTIIIKNAAFTRNNLTGRLLLMSGKSNATIQDKTLTKNKISTFSKTILFPVYHIFGMSTIVIKNAAFTRNNVTILLIIKENSNAVLQNNVLTENEVSFEVYRVSEKSTIQLNNVTFTGNSLKRYLLYMTPTCSATINNNSIIGNKYLDCVF